MIANSIEEFFGTLQQSIVEEWRKHLKTSKYSKHMALDEYYKEMPEKVDALIEAYIGVNGKIDQYKNIMDASEMDALQYLEEIREMCKDGRKKFLDGNTELESNLDDIIGLVDSTIYKVRELKEGIFTSISNFIKESANTPGYVGLASFIRESMNEATQVPCEVIYRKYARFDHNNGKRTLKYKAEDTWDAVYKLTQKLMLYVSPEEFEDGDYSANTPAEREDMAVEAIESIESSNGDGCDLILFFKVGNVVLIDTSVDGVFR